MGLFVIPKNTTAVQGIPIGRLNNIDNRVSKLETGGLPTTLNVETPVEAPDGTRTTFTVSHTPKFVVSDQGIGISGFGYTYSAPTITMNIAPVQFIRSFY